MSHHWNTPAARQDLRPNLCFRLSTPGTTVIAMTVNPDAGISAASSPGSIQLLRAGTTPIWSAPV